MNMEWKWRPLALTLAGLTLGLATQAVAADPQAELWRGSQPPTITMKGHRMMRPWHPRGIGRILAMKDELQLMQEQVKGLQGLQVESQKDRIRRRAEILVARLDLWTVLREDPVDIAQAEAKIREISAKRADARVARLQPFEKAKGILSADQRAKFIALLQTPPAVGRMGEGHWRR